MSEDHTPRPAGGNRRRTPPAQAAGGKRRRTPPAQAAAQPVGGGTGVDGPFPRGPVWVPENPGGQIEPKGGPPFDLSEWRPDVPMLLVPIRLETRYVSGDEHDELRIRILPDPLSVKGAAPASAGELDEARDFWGRYHAATGPDQRAATWRQYARRLGSTRAGYAARLTRPVVAADRRLTFPQTAPETSAPGLAALLPQRWMATGWVGDTVAFQTVSKPVSGPLAVSPDPTAPAKPIMDSELRIDPATAWLFDYQQALDRGMAITVPLTGPAAIADQGLSALLVLGIDESQRPSDSIEEMMGLFEQHSRSSGLAFVPQGTATNNTETVRSGYRRDDTELADLEDRELGTYRPNDDDNAVVLARALGLPSSELFGRLAHGADSERVASRDMRIALFETVLGTYARDLLATHGTDSDVLTDRIDDGVVAALRSWFVTWVTGGAPVPTLRVGDQPYGILPVMARTDASHSSETKQRIAAAVEVLIEEWRQALPAVPVLDHNATDASRPGGELSNAEARDLVTAVLANNPHARRIAIRAASDWSDQPQPGIFGATARAVAVRSTVEQPVGNDLWWEPVLMELTGGFRWEYHDALEMLDTRYGTTLKPLYEGVRHEIAPAGPVLDDGVVTDPIGGVGRAAAGDPAARTLEPSEMPSSEDDIRGIEQQIEIWVQTDSRIPTWGITLEWAKVDLPEVHELAQDVIEQLERHELRQRPLRWLGVPGLDGVLGRDDLQLLLTRFASVERLWRRATVQDDDPPAGITAATYLEHLSERARPGASDGGPFDPRPWDPTDPLPDGGTLPHRPFPFDLLPPEFTAAAPLLYQLIEATLNQSDDRAELSEALARLAVLDPGDLDWLLRETLGLGSHRLDAWHTSLATERLSAMRDASPNGLYVGSIGFVLDLDRATDRPSHGFIHAPSLPHAASAAVLRSGWLARGDNDSESPSAIDLASGRVRDADFMLSGVRHGQDLGDLLGAQFERSLHDARLDVAIRPLRLALAAVDGLGESAADQPIDGIRLLDLHRDGQFRSTIDALELGQEPRRQLVAELDRLESTFDAIDDVTTFETVHQLVVGNLERAAAVVDGMGPNGGRPPELLGVRTPRGALTIDTRALVLIEATATSADAGWATGTRDLFDPALDAWVATVLPPPADVGWLATSAEGKAVEVRLSELGLSALDACFLASDDPRAVTPGLRRLAELADPRRTLTDVQPTEGGSARITLAEFQLLAIELKRLIQESTPADGRSVVAPEDVLGSNSDAGDTIERGATALDALMGDFDAVVKGGSWSDLTHEQSTTLARLGLVPSPTTDPSDDFASLQARLARRRSRADAVEGTDSIEGMRLRVAEITGMAVPLLVDFHMPDDGGVELSGALATADEIDDWFDVVASVHPTVGALWRAMGISTLLGQSPPTVAAGQAPLLDDDPWVALHRPRPGSGGRVAVAAITHGAVDPGTSVVGLVVDQWAERIPADDQVTGVAFHFDAPSAEAPQTMLLAVPPEGRGWSVDLVLDTMLQTIEWMQLRTVAVDDLGDYGHALPTTFVPGALDGSAVEDVTQ